MLPYWTYTGRFSECAWRPCSLTTHQVVYYASFDRVPKGWLRGHKGGQSARRTTGKTISSPSDVAVRLYPPGIRNPPGG